MTADIPGLVPVLLGFCPKAAEVGRLDEAGFLSCTLELSDTKIKREKEKKKYSVYNITESGHLCFY